MPRLNLDELMTAAEAAQRALLNAAESGDTITEIDAGHHCSDVLDMFMFYENHRPNVPEPANRYNRDQVSRALNDALSMLRDDPRIISGSSRSDAAVSLMDLLVNTALERLTDPGVSLDAVIDSCYQVGDQECSECGNATFVEENGISHHYGSGIDRTDHLTDADHVAIPHPASAADMVFGWLEDIN